MIQFIWQAFLMGSSAKTRPRIAKGRISMYCLRAEQKLCCHENG